MFPTIDKKAAGSVRFKYNFNESLHFCNGSFFNWCKMNATCNEIQIAHIMKILLDRIQIFA